jgi:hypothetical protein
LVGSLISTPSLSKSRGVGMLCGNGFGPESGIYGGDCVLGSPAGVWTKLDQRLSQCRARLSCCFDGGNLSIGERSINAVQQLAGHRHGLGEFHARSAGFNLLHHVVALAQQRVS